MALRSLIGSGDCGDATTLHYNNRHDGAVYFRSACYPTTTVGGESRIKQTFGSLEERMQRDETRPNITAQ